MKRTEFSIQVRTLRLLETLILGLTLFMCCRNSECEEMMLNAASHAKPGLAIELKTDKNDYGLHDAVVLHITLTNSSASPIYVYKSLHEGDLAGLSIWAKDVVSGKNVPRRFISDALPPPPKSKEAFVEIAPHASYTVDIPYTMQEFNIASNGTYELFAEYQSPIPHTMNFGLPIWSREKGSTRSNSVKITISR